MVKDEYDDFGRAGLQISLRVGTLAKSRSTRLAP